MRDFHVQSRMNGFAAKAAPAKRYHVSIISLRVNFLDSNIYKFENLSLRIC
jgi:hypothetical protein